MRVALVAWLGAAAFVASASPARADTLLVPEDYTLMAALAAAQPGDVVSVADLTLDGGEVVVATPITLLSRTGLGNRIERLRLDAAADSVEVVGFHIGYHNPLEGISVPERPQGIRIDAPRARLVDCLIQGLVPGGDGGFPLPGEVPVAIAADSQAEFIGCTFRGNATGGNMHGEVIAANCIFQGSWVGKQAAPLRLEACDFVQQGGAIVAAGPLQLLDCTFRSCGGYLVTAHDGLLMTGNVVSRFRLTEWSDCAFAECFEYTTMVRAWGSAQIEHNTFVDTEYVSAQCACPYPTPAQVPALIVLDAGATGSIGNNLFIGQAGAAVEAPAAVTVACNDAFQSADVHWRGGIGDVTGVAGNVSLAPLFCGRAQGDYTISIYSPAAPEHSGGCGMIGALGTQCETEVPALVRSFRGRRGMGAGEGAAPVALAWELSSPATIFVRRVAGGTTTDVYRSGADDGTTGSFVDAKAPAGAIRYGLGMVEDAAEIYPLAWVDVMAARGPSRSRIEAVSPNPFNPATVVRFIVAADPEGAAAPARLVRVGIHDLAGREVARLADEALAPGPYGRLWTGTDRAGRPVASGVYFVVLTVDGARAAWQKVALLR